MTPYAWSCLACEASNPAGSSACGRCSCPAQATSAQVERACQAWRVRSGLPAAESFDVVEAVMALPLLLIAAGVFALLGGLALIVSTNASFTAFGALLLALGALCLSSYRSRSAPA
ncbi:MAG: hypothetical protein ABI887_08530 [Burkholderiales bacterium]